jgi:hypothetical protein
MLRSTRLRKSTRKTSERASNALLVSQIVDSNVQKQRELHVLQPVPTELPAEPAILEQPLPIYHPLYNYNILIHAPVCTLRALWKSFSYLLHTK